MNAHRGRHVVRITDDVGRVARSERRPKWILHRIAVGESNPRDVAGNLWRAYRIACNLGVRQLVERKVRFDQIMGGREGERSESSGSVEICGVTGYPVL